MVTITQVLWAMYMGFVKTLPAGLRDALTVPPPTTEDYTNILAGEIKMIAEKLSKMHREGKETTPEEAISTFGVLQPSADTIWGDMSKIVAAAGAIPFVSLAGWASQRYQHPAAAAYFQASQMYWYSQFQFGLLPLIQRHWMSTHQPFIPEPYRLARAAARELITETDFLHAMMQQGYNIDWAYTWRDQELEYPTLEIALSLFRRGKITGDDFDLWMTRQNIPAEVRTKLILLSEAIPPLSDMIHFAVREAYGTHTPEEQYPAYEKDAALMGLTATRAMQYWYSHWVRIPLTQMYDNLRRGHWTPEKFMSMLRLVDIHPDDREDIFKVAFTPLTIREMGYAYDVGTVTRADIVKYRRWGGLDPDTAELAADSLIAYRTEAEREALRRAYLAQYVAGKIDKTTFSNHLGELRTNPQAKELWLERGDVEKATRETPAVTEPVERLMTASEILYAFNNKLKDETWARDRLAELDWRADRIEQVIVNEKHQAAQKAIVKPVEPRKLTLAQIQSLYRAGKITLDATLPLIRALDYDSAKAALLQELMRQAAIEPVEVKRLTKAEVADLYDVGWYDSTEIYLYFVSLNYPEEESIALTITTVLAVELPTLKAKYSKGWMTSNQMYNRLLEIGIPDFKANDIMMTIVKAEQPARVERERDLTKAEIVKGVKIGIITPEQGVGLLESLDYETWEAWFILGINKVVGAGDPEGYWEMRWVTEMYKKARGEKHIDIPDAVILLERQIRDMKDTIKAKTEAGESAETIAILQTELGALEKQLRDALVKAKLQ